MTAAIIRHSKAWQQDFLRELVQEGDATRIRTAPPQKTTSKAHDQIPSHAIHLLSRLPQIPLRRHLLLPLPPIRQRHIDAPHAVFFQAPIVDVVALGVTPRDRHGRDAAVFAKHVLGRSGAESVDFEILFAGEGFEGGLVDDETLEACAFVLNIYMYMYIYEKNIR